MRFTNWVLIALLGWVIGGCGDNIKLASDASIDTFSINGHPGTISGDQITVDMPAGTDVTNLSPSVTFTGASLTPESGLPQDFTSPVVYTVVAENGHTRAYTASVKVALALSTEKAITAFSFETSHNAGLTADITATISGTTISATVPFGTDVSALVATFTTTGKSVTVGTTAQVSGSTPNNFTSPVSYKVTAEDSSNQTYTVTVTIAPNTAKALTSFKFVAADNVSALTADVTAAISGTTITATVPFGTNVTNLVATFSTTGTSVKVGTTLQMSGVTANNFANPVVYTVAAADNSTQSYTVTVNIAANTAKAITAFRFTSALNSAVLSTDVIAVIAGTTITATVPYGTDVTNLIATYATTGSSVKIGTIVQASGVTANNFTTQLVYTVVAADNSTQDYTVIVNIALNSAKDITSFSFLTVDNALLSVNVTGVISGDVITAILPFGTSKTSLIARFATTGASVNIGGVAQTTGVTVNDFTNDVVYTVVASDGTTKNYTVKVDNTQSNAKAITAFAINGTDGIISGDQITLTLANGTDVTSLVPTISIIGKSVTPASGVPNDFTGPATYVVTAADNTTKTYTVTVTLANLSAKDITRFTINGLDAIIASTSATTGTISLNMPNGTNLSALSPIVTITGVSVTPASGQTINFSNGVVHYIVTAADNTTKDYTVDIGIVNGNGTKLISSFSILGVQGQISNGASSATVTLTLPAGTDLSAQTPTIVINGSSLTPPSRVPQDFRQPVQYTVTAADGSTRIYTVTVTLSP